jgi:hypothetical protein
VPCCAHKLLRFRSHGPNDGRERRAAPPIHHSPFSDTLSFADAIEAKYRERGFIISRAYVPPQRVGLTTNSIAVGPRLSYAAGLAARLGASDDRVGVDAGDSIIVRPAEAGL